MWLAVVPTGVPTVMPTVGTTRRHTTSGAKPLDCCILSGVPTAFPAATGIVWLLVLICFPHTRVRLSAKKDESPSEIAETASFAALGSRLLRTSGLGNSCLGPIG